MEAFFVFWNTSNLKRRLSMKQKKTFFAFLAMLLLLGDQT